MKKFMEFTVENWALVIAFICGTVYCIQRIAEFIALPTEKKKAEVIARLLDWVREAEAELGGKTGEFKLSQVYNKFCEAYPLLKRWISLEKFNEWVGVALAEMKKKFEDEAVKANALGENRSSSLPLS